MKESVHKIEWEKVKHFDLVVKFLNHANFGSVAGGFIELQTGEIINVYDDNRSRMLRELIVADTRARVNGRMPAIERILKDKDGCDLPLIIANVIGNVPFVNIPWRTGEYMDSKSKIDEFIRIHPYFLDIKKLSDVIECLSADDTINEMLYHDREADNWWLIHENGAYVYDSVADILSGKNARMEINRKFDKITSPIELRTAPDCVFHMLDDVYEFRCFRGGIITEIVNGSSCIYVPMNLIAKGIKIDPAYTNVSMMTDYLIFKK